MQKKASTYLIEKQHLRPQSQHERDSGPLCLPCNTQNKKHSMSIDAGAREKNQDLAAHLPPES